MTRQCVKCNYISIGLFVKKNRCYKCGGRTEKIRAKKLKDVYGFIPKEEIYKC